MSLWSSTLPILRVGAREQSRGVLSTAPLDLVAAWVAAIFLGSSRLVCGDMLQTRQFLTVFGTSRAVSLAKEARG